MQLTKHHALGNDFLIALDQGEMDRPGQNARAWCHRTTGIGADGLIVARSSPDRPTTMALFNSDGSRAETSGNGLRCLVQALSRRSGGATWEGAIRTDAGIRRGWFTAGPGSTDRVRVEMGRVTPGPAIDPDDVPIPVVAGHVETVDVGNPHVVIHVADPGEVVLAEIGPAVESLVPGGANIHFVEPRSDASLRVTHWERGAGATSACGSGAVACAHAAHLWGAVGAEVRVEMPGGDVCVRLGDPALLEGDATFVASIEMEGTS